MRIDLGKRFVVYQNVRYHAVDHLVFLHDILEQFLKVGKGRNTFFAL